MGSNKKTVLVILLAVVVIAGIAAGLYLKKTKGPSKEVAQNGEIVKGFPKDMVLDSKGSANESYAVAYANNAQQYTVQFKSDKSVAQVYNDYIKFLDAKGYQFLNRNQNLTIGNIYAQNKNNELVTMVISRLADQTETNVNITYVQQ